MSFWRNTLLATRPEGLERYAETLARCPDSRNRTARVSCLAIAPVKALGMLFLGKVVVGPNGLRTSDRALVDRGVMIGEYVDGKPWACQRFSQRQAPELALSKPEWNGRHLKYSAPGLPDLMLSTMDLAPIDRTGIPVRITNDDQDVHILVPREDALTDWIRLLIKTHGAKPEIAGRVTALYRRPGSVRYVERQHSCGTGAKTTLTDGGQLHVASVETLAWMNACLAEETPGFEPLLMDAFRPNIAFDGLPPNMEDVVSLMKFGQRRLRFGGLTVRCAMTKVIQATGKVRADNQPIDWLIRHRPSRPPENNITFGVNCVFDPTGGDEEWVLDAGASFVVTAER